MKYASVLINIILMKEKKREKGGLELRVLCLGGSYFTTTRVLQHLNHTKYMSDFSTSW